MSQVLDREERTLADRQWFANRILQELETERAQLRSLETRLLMLVEDLRKNEDVRTLRRLGSATQLSTVTSSCPTCHQEVSDSLLPQDAEVATMSVEDNILYLREQQRTFEWMRNNTRRALEAKTQQLDAVRDEMREIRARIRSLKEALVSDARLPSAAAIQELVVLEERIRRTEQLEEDLTLQLGECCRTRTGASTARLSVRCPRDVKGRRRGP
jgi:chromosome segregation ATPase